MRRLRRRALPWQKRLAFWDATTLAKAREILDRYSGSDGPALAVIELSGHWRVGQWETATWKRAIGRTHIDTSHQPYDLTDIPPKLRAERSRRAAALATADRATSYDDPDAYDAMYPQDR